HRDIKPSNLILTRPESPLGPDKQAPPVELIKILDMGLARLDMPSSNEEVTPLTVDGVLMGTPDYMAPEQALDSHRVDIRADLYSLGCTFYQLLTNTVPFPGGNFYQKL